MEKDIYDNRERLSVLESKLDTVIHSLKQQERALSRFADKLDKEIDSKVSKSEFNSYKKHVLWYLGMAFSAIITVFIIIIDLVVLQ